LGICRDSLGVDGGDTLNVGEVQPLVRVGTECIVQEGRIPSASRLVLRRERDEVAEATGRHRVLIREEAVVRGHVEVVSTRHGPCQEEARHAPGGHGWHR
jgi:hypothetical protein